MAEPQQTRTTEEMEEEFGVTPTRPYALRADQLADGTYRYALEDQETGEALAEGVDREDQTALSKFEASLAASSLSPQEVTAFREALRAYERHA